MKAEPEAEHEARLAAERLGLPFLLYRDGEGGSASTSSTAAAAR